MHQIELWESLRVDSMPKGRTCFFTLQMPEYTSDEVFNRLLIFAIENTVLIEGDRIDNS